MAINLHTIANKTNVAAYDKVLLAVEPTGGTEQYQCVWTQISGSPTVTLLGGSSNRKLMARPFVAPAVATPGGTTLVFRASVTDANGITATDTVSISIKQHKHFEMTSSGKKSVRIKARVQQPRTLIGAGIEDPKSGETAAQMFTRVRTALDIKAYRHFFGGDNINFNASELQTCRTYDIAYMVSFNDWNTTKIGNFLDAANTSFNNDPTQHPIRIVVRTEPETTRIGIGITRQDNGTAVTMTAAMVRDWQGRMRTMIDQRGLKGKVLLVACNVQTALDAAEYPQTSKLNGSRNWDALDELGYDIYRENPDNPTGLLEGYRAAARDAAQFDMPWCVPETGLPLEVPGSVNSTNRSQTYSNALDFARKGDATAGLKPATFVCLWHFDAGTKDYRLDNYPQEQAVFASHANAAQASSQWNTTPSIEQ